MRNKTRRQPSLKTIRRGYTFIELLVSMGAATILLAGLPSCIFIVTQSFDGNTSAVKRAETTSLQMDILNDLKHALSFQQLTANSVTMLVPDRDGDGSSEQIQYSWSGRQGDPLVYQYNSGASVNLVEDVYHFNLLNLTRYATAPVIPPPEEIAADQNVFGYDTVFTSIDDRVHDRQIATQVTLLQDATLLSISAYLETEDEKFGFAIYSDDNGEPGTLLASTGFVVDPDGGGEGWKTLTVPETPLSAGTYWLALALDDKWQSYFFQSTGGQSRIYNYNPFFSGFSSSWGNGPSGTQQISIYGTYSTD